VLEVDRGKLDLWPEHVLGCKPALPDQRLPTHPCRHLSRGKLPVSGGLWAHAAELPASGRNSVVEPGADEYAPTRSALALGAYDAWGNSVVSVCMDLVDLVCQGLGTRSATAQAINVGTRCKWLRSLRNGDCVRAVRQGARDISRLEHRTQQQRRQRQRQLQIEIATVVGWHPGTQYLRLCFPGGGKISSSEQSVHSFSLSILAEDQAMRHHVQPAGPSTDFDTFSATERAMPRAMERVYICLEVRIRHQTEIDRNSVSSSLSGSDVHAATTPASLPGVAGGNAAMKKDGAKLVWVPGFVSKADVTSQRVWVRILGQHECDPEPLDSTISCLHACVLSGVVIVATAPFVWN
jgi:hypothetical protein